MAIAEDHGRDGQHREDCGHQLGDPPHQVIDDLNGDASRPPG